MGIHGIDDRKEDRWNREGWCNGSRKEVKSGGPMQWIQEGKGKACKGGKRQRPTKYQSRNTKGKINPRTQTSRKIHQNQTCSWGCSSAAQAPPSTCVSLGATPALQTNNGLLYSPWLLAVYSYGKKQTNKTNKQKKPQLGAKRLTTGVCKLGLFPEFLECKLLTCVEQ